jgi:hypothetical protein
MRPHSILQQRKPGGRPFVLSFHLNHQSAGFAKSGSGQPDGGLKKTVSKRALRFSSVFYAPEA